MSETKKISPIEDMRSTMARMEPQLKMALPKHIPVDKFTRVVMTAIQQNPKLLNVTRQSLLAETIKCASDGLIPDGREASIIPFGNEAKYMPQVAGICKKARNSGEVATIGAHIVYKNDKFKFYVDADGEHLQHEPLLFGDRGEMIGVYAIAKLKDGEILIEPMSIEEVNKVRSVSRSKDSGPWRDWFSEMAKKTSIRRLAKYRLPSSTDLLNTIRADDDLFMPDKEVKGKSATTVKTESLPAPAVEPEILEAEPEDKPASSKKSSRLRDAVEKKAQPKEQEPDYGPPEDKPIDRPAIFESEEETDLDQALNGETI